MFLHSSWLRTSKEVPNCLSPATLRPNKELPNCFSNAQNGLHVNLASLLAFFPGQWGTDVQVHDYFVTADFQTDDPKEAARGRGLPWGTPGNGKCYGVFEWENHQWWIFIVTFDCRMAISSCFRGRMLRSPEGNALVCLTCSVKWPGG